MAHEWSRISTAVARISSFVSHGLLAAGEGTRYEVRNTKSAVAAVLAIGISAGCAGCGYSNRSLYPEDIRSVCIDMFDNRTFRRGLEYTLSDALAKRIESDTPYRIVSDKDRTDSVLSGQIISINESILTLDRETGRALEKEVMVAAVVNWKNLTNGRLMLNNATVTAAASYSDLQSQDFTYASSLAANKLAQKIVEVMENNW